MNVPPPPQVVLIGGEGTVLPTLIVLVALATEPQAGVFVVKVKITVPEKFATGVYVTAEGLLVCDVLLNVPPPEVMDHAAVVAPTILAPLKALGDGFIEQKVLGPPAFTDARGVTVTSTVNADPVQVLATGVTVYLSTPPVVLVNVCAIVFPHEDEQFVPPDTDPDCTAAVHV